MGTESRCRAQDSSLIIDGCRQERRLLQAGEEMMLRRGDGRALGQAQGFPVVHFDWTCKGEARGGGRQGCSYARAKPRGPAWSSEGLHSTRKETRVLKQLCSGEWCYVHFSKTIPVAVA